MTRSNDSVFERNIAYYSHAWAVQQYSVEQGLRDIERGLAETFLPAPAARVLDMGCGAGRTTAGLAGLGYDVTAIDLSEPLIAHARELYPALDFRVMNAAALTLDAKSFDAAFFSFNGIDCIFPLEERRRCLAEVARVLKPGGIFVFSTHNGIGHLFSGGWFYLRGYRNALKLIADQLGNGDIFNWYLRYEDDPAGAQVLFSAPPSATAIQLREAGFDVVDIRSATGERRPTRVRWHAPHVYFVARKRL
jgi:SAM-dependent methyltransferase